MVNKAELNEIRARLMVIVGQAHNINQMLGDVSCPADRIPYIDISSKNVLKELQRMTHVLALGVEQEKNKAYLSFAG